MGAGMMPQSPLATAQMMAGLPTGAGAFPAGMPGLGGAMAAASTPGMGQGMGMGMGQGMGLGLGLGLGQGMPSPMAMPGGPGASGGGTSLGKMADAPNQGVQPGAASRINAQTEGDSRVGDGDGDSAGDARRRAADRQAWMANLPPAIRDALQSRGKRELPRGYEERLKEYFENLD